MLRPQGLGIFAFQGIALPKIWKVVCRILF